ncbi:hypothetical protein D3C73_546530 [compost metagenome]
MTVLQQHQRHGEFVPGGNEIEDQKRSQHRQRDRQEYPAKNRDMRGPVDQRRFRQLLRHRLEEAMQDEDLVGHAEGQVRQDDAGIGIDQTETVHQGEDRRQHDLERDHRTEEEEQKQQFAETQPDPCQSIGSHGRKHQAERHLDDGDDDAVLERRLEIAARPGAGKVVPGDGFRRRKCACCHNLGIRLERRECDQNDGRNPD